jgi:sulfoxide reductase heme-binding subunit YedZ
MSAVELSSDAGLAAMVLLTINILLGMVLSARYNTLRSWPHRRLPIFDIHNWTAYIALGLIVAHPVLLLLSTTAKFGVLDILFPLRSPHQTLYNNLGAAAFYCVFFVIVTSYIRSKLGSRLWKKLHYVSYGAAALLLVHGLMIDPDLKEKPPDYLDGEKVLIEVCALLIIVASTWRIRYQAQKRAVGATVNKIDYEAV